MGHANTPPTIPEIKDEAGDSPKWLPLLGVGLFVLLVGWVVVSHTSTDEDTAAEAP